MQYPVLNKDSIKTDISETKAKVPILLKGSWHVPGYGPLIVTDNYIDKVIENFNSNVLGFKPYATLGHLTDSPDPKSIDGERKRGDLEEIIKEGDIVYGIYNINKETFDLLKNGEYEYSSPEIQDNFKDKVTGEVVGPTLLRTALTNAPFMPFNEHKIVTLSQNSNKLNNSICLKLSTNVINNDKEDIKDIETINLISEEKNINNSESTISTEVPIQMSTQQNEVINSVAPVVAEPQATVSKTTVDFEALIAKNVEAQEALAAKLNELTNKFSEGLEAVSNKTNEAVNAISTKVEEISNQVNSVTAKTENNQQYIAALSSSEKAKRLNDKLNAAFEAGATPAALSTAKAIITNFESGNNVVKLSVKGNEKEVSFEDAIIDLIKLSSNAMPNEVQAGALQTAPATSYLDNLIAENREKAKKLIK